MPEAGRVRPAAWRNPARDLRASRARIHAVPGSWGSAWLAGGIAPRSCGDWGRGTREKPRFCRVGRSNEPAINRWNRCDSRASGFLATEACTTRGVAVHFVVTLAQTSLRAITHKAGSSNSEPNLSLAGREGQAPAARSRPSGTSEALPDSVAVVRARA